MSTSLTNTFKNSFPLAKHPLVDTSGCVTDPWLRLIQSLWNRTGSYNGFNGPGLVDNVNSIVLSDVTNLDMIALDEVQNVRDPFVGLLSSSEGVQDPFVGLSTPSESDPSAMLPAISELRELGYAAGFNYPLVSCNVSATGALAAENRIYLVPFYVRAASVRFSSFSARVVTGGAGSAAKLGVWATYQGLPSGLPIVADNTGVATTTSGAIVTFAAAATLTRGWYYYGVKVTSATRPVFLNIPGTGTEVSSLHGAPTASAALGNGATVQAAGLFVDDAYANPMPDLTSASFSASTGASQGVPIISALVA
jgi:hypothetical protein